MPGLRLIVHAATAPAGFDGRLPALWVRSVADAARQDDLSALLCAGRAYFLFYHRPHPVYRDHRLRSVFHGLA